MRLVAAAFVARGEARMALRSRGLLGLGAAFALASVGVAIAASSQAGYVGLMGFQRTAASLVPILGLLLPLPGLALGAGTVAAERPNGVLRFLMSHPVTPGEVIVGKWLGHGSALAATILGGIGLMTLTLPLASASHLAALAQIAAYSLLLALAGLSMGILLSCLAKTPTAATGAGILAWLAIVFGADLVVLALRQTVATPPPLLWFLLAANPVDAFRLSSLIALGAGPETLGPVADWAFGTMGSHIVAPLIGFLLAWIIVPLAASAWLLRRRGP